eukprot:4867912-Amphidinium_carterae.1
MSDPSKLEWTVARRGLQQDLDLRTCPVSAGSSLAASFDLRCKRQGALSMQMRDMLCCMHAPDIHGAFVGDFE